MTLSWPMAVVFSVVVLVEGALVWHGSLNAHALTATISVTVGYAVGRTNAKGAE